ncbi:LysR substrate-binding domain-containing protein [Marinobacterium rhizophilum]|uniref:LysR family transcriptional regulator n=1 Tax=Marinobacterium rhizophilum TaxID=420402 RepID=A0ABY5HL89_9GAMM|nr:LysR substrate-binding domain-containing protein [Marinobacterium rhizophilum]UTW11691.1 LysR family transcriptional regulator [Marinobacterium rhizophilum]
MRSLPPLTALRVFETTGKYLSFTHAAKQLHVTQSAVSRQIKQLEDYLGVPLFVRLHHKLELTDAGQQLLAKLEQAFNLMEVAVQELRDPNQRQKLNLLVPPTFATRWLAPRLAGFHRSFPELELSIHNSASEHSLFDCSIRFGHTAKPSHYSELLMLEQHLAVCAPHMTDKAQQLDKANASLLHILDQGERLPVWENWLQAAGMSDQVNVNRGMEFSTLDQVINAAINGAGFAIIDRHMITRELESGTLVAFSDIEVSGPCGYWLDINAERQGLAKVIRFSEWLREVAADSPTQAH